MKEHPDTGTESHGQEDDVTQSTEQGGSGKSRTSRWRAYAINAFILVVVFGGVRTWQHRDIVSGAAPALQGMTLSGRPFILPAQPARPVLVHFWATWCPICRVEQHSIDGIAQENSNVITVAMKSGTQDEIVKFMREQGIDFPVLNDPDGRIASDWGVNAVPASFIISPDGQIDFVEVGYTTGVGLKLRLWLSGLGL